MSDPSESTGSVSSFLTTTKDALGALRELVTVGVLGVVLIHPGWILQHLRSVGVDELDIAGVKFKLQEQLAEARTETEQARETVAELEQELVHLDDALDMSPAQVEADPPAEAVRIRKARATLRKMTTDVHQAGERLDHSLMRQESLAGELERLEPRVPTREFP